MSTPIPEVLYKYRHFNERTIELLCADLAYFADPASFNDPLDAKPCVEIDCDKGQMEQAVFEMVRRRVHAEMQAAASSIKYRGPRTMEHIDKHSRAAAQKFLDELRYRATDPDHSDEPPGPLANELSWAIESELLRRYETGVLSLATRYDCPLMWSHYGDQHRGLCIGYALPEKYEPKIHQVRYGGERRVRASDVVKMVLYSEVAARKSVDEAVLLRKASDWHYEKEWRMLGPRGATDSSLEMVEIHFGMRCPRTVMHTVAAALNGRDKTVELYQMSEVRGTFNLGRSELDVSELGATYPRRALTVSEDFEQYIVEPGQPEI
ncbi:hypothetical protein AYM40_09785 [Paraburkholderia phytofirmans OLGA172]|uniref:DUF2971 domain-containing protein n=2 Tax=Paraburkholderia phytofirmans TaxID=261302 RepID=A0A160FJX6_9BURK|nr:hypothetical protein AYM40_09785 [Paraburkholderia phytofirmans OLGA172]